MNYLTLYYKNLSEQLQGQVNLLEAELKKISDYEPYPTPSQMAAEMMAGTRDIKTKKPIKPKKKKNK